MACSKINFEMEWIGGKDLKINFSSKSMDPLLISKSKVSPEEEGGEARELLGASVMECMGSTVFFLLKWGKIKLEDFKSYGEIITAKGEDGRNYIDTINLEFIVDIPKDEETLKRFDRVKKILERGCLLGRSLERGIKVNHNLSIRQDDYSKSDSVKT